MRAPILLALLLAAGCPRPEGPSQSGKSAASNDLDAGASAGPASSKPGVPVTQSPAERADLGTAPPVPTAPAVERPKTVKIRLASSPKTTVRWGKKTLGITPLVVERPLDSGPMDLVFVARGYFPVHTRAFTFKNDSVHVSMTKLGDRAKLYGAKKEAPPAATPPACDPTAGPCPPPSAPATPPVPAPAPAPAPPPTPTPTPTTP